MRSDSRFETDSRSARAVQHSYLNDSSARVRRMFGNMRNNDTGMAGEP